MRVSEATKACLEYHQSNSKENTINAYEWFFPMMKKDVQG